MRSETERHWVTVDGEIHVSKWGRIFQYSTYARKIAKKLQRENPSSKVEIWHGWIIKEGK